MRPEHIRFGSLGGQTRFRTFPSRVGAGSINVLATFGRFGQNAQLVVGNLSEPAGDEHMLRLPVDAEIEVANGQSGQKRDVMRQDAEFTFDTRNTDVIHGLADHNFVTM